MLKQSGNNGSSHEVMEVFRKIVAGCATVHERQRYLNMWKHATSLREAGLPAESSSRAYPD